jgi:hypothetical protein
MGWGSETAVGAGDTGVANTWQDLNGAAFTTANPYDVYHFSINADNESGSVVDALEIRVLSSPGANWDDTPVFAMSFLPTAITDEYVGFTVSGYYKFKVQVQSAGATDTYDVTDSKFILYTN